MLASAPATTVTVLADEAAPLVATTVFSKVAALSPAVKSPELLIVPPPCATDHVGVTSMGLPSASFTTAVNWSVPATGVCPLGAVITIDAATRGAVTLSLPPHPESTTAAKIAAGISRAQRAARVEITGDRLFDPMDTEALLDWMRATDDHLSSRALACASTTTVHAHRHRL
jgi:hypothetical protein